jgi:hypothetical protein
MNRLCPDCGKPLQPHKKYCEQCRIAHVKATDRRLATEHKVLRRCTTPRCIELVGGKNQYCDKCKKDRLIAGRNKSDKRVYNEVCENSAFIDRRPTSYAWLKGFSAWAASGMQYADYQKMERSHV